MIHPSCTLLATFPRDDAVWDKTRVLVRWMPGEACREDSGLGGVLALCAHTSLGSDRVKDELGGKLSTCMSRALGTVSAPDRIVAAESSVDWWLRSSSKPTLDCIADRARNSDDEPPGVPGCHLCDGDLRLPPCCCSMKSTEPSLEPSCRVRAESAGKMTAALFRNSEDRDEAPFLPNNTCVLLASMLCVPFESVGCCVAVSSTRALLGMSGSASVPEGLSVRMVGRYSVKWDELCLGPCVPGMYLRRIGAHGLAATLYPCRVPVGAESISARC